MNRITEYNVELVKYSLTAKGHGTMPLPDFRLIRLLPLAALVLTLTVITFSAAAADAVGITGLNAQGHHSL
ncbi:hypothetical protein O5286_29005 [Escherichia coli]|nr:hypothetical protein [Escherichia coli]